VNGLFGDGKIVLGFAPTIRGLRFGSIDWAKENKKAIAEAIGKLADKDTEIVGIDWLNAEGMLYNFADVSKAAQHFRQKGVNALFIAHCNFGSEEVVGKLGQAMGVPVLLWGPRDDIARSGDTQCGIFASSKALTRYGVPFTYIENCRPTDRAFTEGFTDFLRVASVAHAFRNMRIGQISVRPKPFLSTMTSEGELLEKFGIEVVPINTAEILSLVDKIKAESGDEADALVRDICARVNCSDADGEGLRNVAALELAILRLARDNDCNAMCSECWMTYRKFLGVGGCFAFGDCADRGLPVACETDVNGAVTLALVKAAARGTTPAFLADLTIRHPDNDNAELLWHCGPFPRSLAKAGSSPAMQHYMGQWEIKGGDITLARFDGVRGSYNLFADEAVGIDGPATNGNYVWAEVDDWVKWEKKFVYGPYIHHVACVHGRYKGVLREACKYMGGVEYDSAD
jgi:L-fucose isomerase-like protein